MRRSGFAGLRLLLTGESVAYIACEDEGVVMCIVDVLTGETVRSKVDREVWPWSIAWAPDEDDRLLRRPAEFRQRSGRKGDHSRSARRQLQARSGGCERSKILWFGMELIPGRWRCRLE